VLAELRASGATRSNGRLPAEIQRLQARYGPQGLRSIEVRAQRGGRAPVVRVDSTTTREIEGRRIESGVRLPDYAEVTAMITVDGQGLLPLRNLRGEHAEERILAHLARYLATLRQPPNHVELLLSQSPCRHRCAPQLGALRAQYPGATFSLYYSALHASTSGTATAASMAALGELEASGWNVAIWAGAGTLESASQDWLR
jgi:hypothetical protein